MVFQRTATRAWRGRFLVAIGVLFAGSLYGAPVTADFTHWSLGPHGGWVHNTDFKENGISQENAFTLGVATRFKLIEVLAAELAVDWRTEDIERNNVETIPVQLSALLYIVPPYVHGTVGVGWYRVKASWQAFGDQVTNFNDDASDAGLHLGAGIEIPVGSRTALTTEGRYVFLGYELKDADQAIKVDADFFNLMVGLQFYVW